MKGNTKNPQPINPDEPVPDDIAGMDTQPIAVSAVMAVREMSNERIRQEQRQVLPNKGVIDFCLEIITRLRGI